MPTLMIRLEHPPPGDLLVIRGFRIRHGEGGWHEDAGPVRELPRDLPTIATPTGDEPLEDLAREALLTTTDTPLSVAELGRRLWHLISDGPIGTWWAEQIDAAGTAPVRTVLDIRPPELRLLPWELMTTDRGRPLFRDASHPWVRANPNWPPLEELLAPVKILVVIGDVEAEDLDVEHELAAIHRCLREKPGSWHVEVVWAPSRRDLRDRYQSVRPHILHMIGHAAVLSGHYVLRMVPAEGEPWGLTVEAVAELPTRPPLLAGGAVAEPPIPAPRLVVLNCCRTTVAGAAAEPLWTFTDAFIELGSAAVVTMQGDIPSRASVEFTSEFYGRLVAGQAIDAAAAGARLRVSDVRQDEANDNRSWALPSLMVATDPDRVLPVKECLSPAELNASPFSSAFGDVQDYLDRSTERRKLLHQLDTDPNPEESRVHLLTGDHLDGRSAVVRSTLLTLRLRGRNAVYVNLDKKRGNNPKLSWLTVLRLIRDAIWEWVPEIPDEPRSRFNHDLSFFLEHREPGPSSATSDARDDGREFPSEGEEYRQWIARILLAFRRMLVAAAEAHPLLIALDSLNAIHDEDLRDVLAEQLLLPLIAGLSPDGVDADVRCVVAASADELLVIPDYVRRPLARTPVHVGPFDRNEVRWLVGEYIARRGLNPPESWRHHVESLLDQAGDDSLRPGFFSNFLRSAESLIPS